MIYIDLLLSIMIYSTMIHHDLLWSTVWLWLANMILYGWLPWQTTNLSNFMGQRHISAKKRWHKQQSLGILMGGCGQQDMGSWPTKLWKNIKKKPRVVSSAKNHGTRLIPWFFWWHSSETPNSGQHRHPWQALGFLCSKGQNNLFSLWLKLPQLKKIGMDLQFCIFVGLELCFYLW